jgi:hypothetical protein
VILKTLSILVFLFSIIESHAFLDCFLRAHGRRVVGLQIESGLAKKLGNNFTKSLKKSKNLNLSHLDLSPEELSYIVKEIGPQVQALSLRGNTQLKNAHILKILEKVPGLKGLDIDGTGFNGHGIERLVKLAPNIEHLVISNVGVIGLSSKLLKLKLLENLSEVDFRNSKLSARSLRKFFNKPPPGLKRAVIPSVQDFNKMDYFNKPGVDFSITIQGTRNRPEVLETPRLDLNMGLRNVYPSELLGFVDEAKREQRVLAKLRPKRKLGPEKVPFEKVRNTIEECRTEGLFIPNNARDLTNLNVALDLNIFGGFCGQLSMINTIHIIRKLNGLPKFDSIELLEFMRKFQVGRYKLDENSGSFVELFGDLIKAHGKHLGIEQTTLKSTIEVPRRGIRRNTDVLNINDIEAIQNNSLSLIGSFAFKSSNKIAKDTIFKAGDAKISHSFLVIGGGEKEIMVLDPGLPDKIFKFYVIGEAYVKGPDGVVSKVLHVSPAGPYRDKYGGIKLTWVIDSVINFPIKPR